MIGQDVGTATELLEHRGLRGRRSRRVPSAAPRDSGARSRTRFPRPGDEGRRGLDRHAHRQLRRRRSSRSRTSRARAAARRRNASRPRASSVGSAFRFSTRCPKDRVIGTEPAAGTPPPDRSRRSPWWSPRASNRVEVPDVVGLDDQAALSALDAGRARRQRRAARRRRSPQGEVIGQSPARGQQVNAGIAGHDLRLHRRDRRARRGRPDPQDRGDGAEEGRVRARRSARRPTDDPSQVGRVIDQFPPGGARGQRGDTVTIIGRAPQRSSPSRSD